MATDRRTEPTAWIERRGLNPRFAEPDPEKRIGMPSNYQTFIAEYREARAVWMLTGSTVFPAGTDKLCNYPGVQRPRPPGGEARRG